MMETAKVHRKYLTVLPKKIRRELDIRVGDELEFHLDKGKAIIVPKSRRSTEAVEAAYGSVKFQGEIETTIGKGYRKMAETKVAKK